MPRYLIERSFGDGLHIPVDETGTKACAAAPTRTPSTRSLGPVPTRPPTRPIRPAYTTPLAISHPYNYLKVLGKRIFRT